MKPTNFSPVGSSKGKSGMLIRIIQLICAIMVLGAGSRSAFGFALGGIKEAYQADNLGYDRVTDIPYPSGGWTIYNRSEEHTSELQSHSFISYAVFCLKKK